MANTQAIATRRVYRRTGDHSGQGPKLRLVQEPLPTTLPPTSVQIKVRAVSINYRDGNIINGTNPWPVIPNGIPCSDAAGEVVAVGDKVESLAIGDHVAPILDQASITGREQGRIWLAADADGVLADFLVFDEGVVCKLPLHLDWGGASTLPCAGITAWTALKAVGMGASVLVQGTGGVSLMTVKLARAAGCKVILSSSSDDKLRQMRERFPHPPIATVNYATNQAWHDEVVRLNGGVGVDLVIENGGTGSLVRSIKCTRRGGIVSQVGYLGKQRTSDLEEFLPILIDRRVNLRGINAGSKHDLQDLCAAVSATKMCFNDIVDSEFPFDKSEEAIDYVWQGKQVGKVVIRL